MNKARVIGVLTSLLTSIGLIHLLAAASQAPVVQWPYEAYQGLVFTLGWGFGVPESISYLVAAVLVISVLVVCYLLGHKLAQCVFTCSKK